MSAEVIGVAGLTVYAVALTVFTVVLAVRYFRGGK
jgi:hypothetical protein